MVVATATREQLADPEAWPVDSSIYDRTVEQFLNSDQARLLAAGIDKPHLHSLVFRPLVEVVPDLVFEGYNVISAPPKIGKTIIMHQLMIAVDMGEDWLGRPCRQGPVLFFGLEDTLASVTARDRRLVGEQRLEQFVTGGAGRMVVTDCGDTPQMRLLRLAEMLEQGHHGRPYALVVVDTSPRFLGSGNALQNAYERGLELTSPLDRLGLRHHVGIVGIHHDRKGDQGDDFDAVSGGMSITGTAQCVMSLRRTRGSDTGVLSVYPRAAEECKLPLEFRSGAWQLSADVAVEVAAEVEGCRRDVMAFLMGCSGATLQDIVQADSVRRHSYANVQQALQRLRTNQKVTINRGVWTAVRDQAAVTASATSPAAAADQQRPRWQETSGPCDRCGRSPARLCMRSGTKWCATCSPAFWPDPVPPAEPVPEPDPPATPAAAVDVAATDAGAAAVDAVVTFQRPPWAPSPLAHPITVWNRLLEDSFRIKKVQLVAHPYPKPDDVPVPFRTRGKGRGMLIHEGAHSWRSPEIEPGTLVTVIDRHASFLGSLGTAELPIGKISHHEGRGPERHRGAHRLDRWPEWSMPHWPHPGGTRIKGKPQLLVASPQLLLMSEYVDRGQLEPFEVTESWTGATLRLEQLQDELRTARMNALLQGDDEFAAFLKLVYSIGLSTTGESSHNLRIWRPEWTALTRATFHSNMFRAARKVIEAPGLRLAAVVHTDELHVVGDPFGACEMPTCEVHPAGWVGSGPFTHGLELKHWGIKGEAYAWPAAA